MPSRFLFLSARSVYFSITGITSIYCILACVTVVYDQIHRSKLFPFLSVVVDIHGFWYWHALFALFYFLVWDRPSGWKLRPSHRRMRLGILVLQMCLNVVFFAFSVVRNLGNDGWSAAWAMLSLAPLLLVGASDWLETAGRLRWSESEIDENHGLFQASVYCSIFLAVVFALIANANAGPAVWSWSGGVAAAAWSLITHLVLWMALFSALNLMGVVATWFSRPPLAQFVLSHLLSAGAICLVLRNLIFRAIAFTGPLADVYAVAFSLTTALFLSGSQLRLQVGREGELRSGLAMALGLPQKAHAKAPRLRQLTLPLLALAVAAWLTIRSVSMMDWNYLVQKMLVIACWILAFRLFLRFQRRYRERHSATGMMLMVIFISLAGYRTMQAHVSGLWKYAGQPGSLHGVLELYAGHDISFRLIQDALVPSISNDPDFFQFLSVHTNIPRSAALKIPPVNMVAQLQKSAGPKPNIFIFLVDSLRRDYLSAYNSKVDFTPNIGNFARESLVAENAFARYGGTMFSVPSMFVGGMIPHKQNITPFAPLNSLEKLLITEDYNCHMSLDPVIAPQMQRWPRLREMDSGRSHPDYDLCATLTELEEQLNREPASQHVFGYSLPQNIHISVISRQGSKPISTEDYGGFHAPYASRIRRIDGCFGRFIQYLKNRRIYDNSIVILAADHGDSLGEGGRWGHAYTIYPEVVRIPLIMHLPPAMRESLYFDPRKLAYLNDISPTLYYLLGHRPILSQEFFGRPLLTEKPEHQGQYMRDYNLMASSYGPVYGILAKDLRTYYVADAVNYRDYLFDLESYNGNPQQPGEADMAYYRKILRSKITALGKHYGYNPEMH